MSAGTNYSVRDEIRDYWSARAETFDLSPGHEIFSEAERVAWHGLILKHLGHGTGRTALDLACGTGVVSHLMHDLDFDVTGLDWSEAMLDKARAKSKQRGSRIRFIMRDAEATGEDEARYDALITRHLVWTLVDPAVAFAEWFSLLKPGGRLLIVDGDFVSRNWYRVLRSWAHTVWSLVVQAKADGMPKFPEQYRNVMAQIYFKSGARAPEVVRLLREAGFEPVVVDTRLGAIHLAQARHMSIDKLLDRATQHRYAICATKPLGP